MENQTKYVIVEIESGVVCAMYSNDPAARIFVIDVDTDYEDANLMKIAQKRLRAMEKAGQLADQLHSPYWALLDEQNCLCTNRMESMSADEYDFAMICPLDDGGFGIAECGEKLIKPGDYDLEDILKAIKSAGLDPDGDEFCNDEDYVGVYAAACLFKQQSSRLLRPGLHFSTYWEARQYLATEVVDCFIAPDITFGQNPGGALPQCFDVEQYLEQMSHDDLVLLNLCYRRYVDGILDSIGTKSDSRGLDHETYRLEYYVLNCKDALRPADYFLSEQPHKLAIYRQMSRERLIRDLLRYTYSLRMEYLQKGTSLNPH